MKLEDNCFLAEKLWQTSQSAKKQRHYFAYKIVIVKAMVFLVVMYGYESWTIKKPES